MKSFSSYLILFISVAITSALVNASNSVVEYSQMDHLDKDTNLKIGDRLKYSVIEDREPHKFVFVNDRGYVKIPLIGDIKATKKTCFKLAKDIKKKLEVDYYYQATVIIEQDTKANYRGQVSLLGRVSSQGAQAIPSDEVFKVSDVILRAGGFSAGADKNNVTLIRKNPNNPEAELKFVLDIGKMLETGNFDEDMIVEPDDTILVSKLEKADGQFYVSGKGVRSPGLYNLPDDRELTVSKAILQAGGFTDFADRKNVKVIRGDPEIAKGEKNLTVNVAIILDEGKRDYDPIVFPNDIIKVKERWIAIK